MVKRLEQQDAFTRPQAETLADALHSAMSEDMVSKADLSATESALRADLKATEAALRSDMTAIRSDVKATEAALRSQMRILEHSLKLWAGALVVGQFAALSGLVTFLRFFH